ncbi:MAG TPA: cytochrome P460 family protein, partial [Luteibacter sp.]|nr:cytochrome P460 family protein [Luteibacter sp.]
MKHTKVLALLTVLVVGLGGIVLSSAAGGDNKNPSGFGDTPPAGYRDWKLISVAHEEGELNDLRAILGNDIAVKAYREGTLPFPD